MKGENPFIKAINLTDHSSGMCSLRVALSSPGKGKKGETGQVFMLKQNEIFIKHVSGVQVVRGWLPCGPLKGSSLLSIVNADFNNGVKAEEVRAEILAKDDSSRFRVAQSSLRD